MIFTVYLFRYKVNNPVANKKHTCLIKIRICNHFSVKTAHQKREAKKVPKRDKRKKKNKEKMK